jgi:uncharacterized membrane protein YjgN (DUF898 family)
MNLLSTIGLQAIKPQFIAKDVVKFYSIQITNLLLIILTLGLYYPWARAATMRFIYQETELAGSRFIFHGKGKEMFRGFIKIFSTFVLSCILFYFLLDSTVFVDLPQSLDMTIVEVIYAVYVTIFVLGLLLTPLIIHGSMKYRLSRTSWRGIHFGYRGTLGGIYKVYTGGLLLTILTFGFYSPWFSVSLRKYVIGNIRMGNLKFAYEGTGADYFFIHLPAFFLIPLTLGLYYFWYQRDLFNFYIDNIVVEQNNKKCYFQSKADVWGIIEWVVVNYLIISFTFGLAIPWAILRTLKFAVNNIIIYGEFNVDDIHQTEQEYKDATSDDLSTMMDVGIV